MTPRQKEALEALREHGSASAAARAMGLSRSGFQGLLRNAGVTPEDKAALYKGAALSVARAMDPAIDDAMKAVGTGLVPRATWVKTEKDENGVARSVLLVPPKEDEREAFRDTIRDTIREVLSGEIPELPPALYA